MDVLKINDDDELRSFNTITKKILTSFKVIYVTLSTDTLEPSYNTNSGVHTKSVLQQNSVIRDLYKGSLDSGSQAQTVS